MPLPGGELSKRELHFVWLTDCSGSMSVKGKIQSLNNAISEAIPEMKKVGEENPNAELLIRALKFSQGAQWHIKDPIQVDNFMWDDLEAGGITDLGQALSMLAKELESSQMPDQGLPPVLVLVSDGQPTDDFEAGLEKLLKLPWGQKAVKIAIAIGDDANIDVLNKFIDNPELEVLQANNSEELTAYIKWASTEVVKSASTGSSEEVAGKSDNVAIPSQPKPDDVDIKPDVDVF